MLTGVGTFNANRPTIIFCTSPSGDDGQGAATPTKSQGAAVHPACASIAQRDRSIRKVRLYNFFTTSFPDVVRAYAMMNLGLSVDNARHCEY